MFCGQCGHLRKDQLPNIIMTGACISHHFPEKHSVCERDRIEIGIRIGIEIEIKIERGFKELPQVIMEAGKLVKAQAS